MLHKRTRVNASPADVWDVVGDPSRWNEFFVGITRWEGIDLDREALGQATIGDRYWIRMGVGSVEAGGRIRFTDVQPGKLLQWETEAGTDHTLRLFITPGASAYSPTTVGIDFELRLLGGLLSRVAERSAYRIVGRNLKATLHVLRHLVEHEHEPLPESS